jgi:2-oxo-4-hydroxy-4-carboxy-5-ureidoimidazoline decarboxylase
MAGSAGFAFMEPWRRIDSATPGEARQLLGVCCGSARWIESMIARRPFGSTGRLLAAADEVWRALSPDDWREAFSHHPKIGDRDLRQTRFASTRHLSEREQSGVAGAPDDVVEQLAKANREYEARFGYIFIVCATGRSAAEMLALLRSRLANDPESEIHVAAGEQAKITALRLSAIE